MATLRYSCPASALVRQAAGHQLGDPLLARSQAAGAARRPLTRSSSAAAAWQQRGQAGLAQRLEPIPPQRGRFAVLQHLRRQRRASRNQLIWHPDRHRAQVHHLDRGQRESTPLEPDWHSERPGPMHAQEFGDHPEAAVDRMRWIRPLTAAMPARSARTAAIAAVRRQAAEAACQQADRSRVGRVTDSRIAVRHATGSAVSWRLMKSPGAARLAGRVLMHPEIPESTRPGWQPLRRRGDMRCGRDAMSRRTTAAVGRPLRRRGGVVALAAGIVVAAAGLWCTLAGPVLAAPASTGWGNFL